MNNQVTVCVSEPSIYRREEGGEAGGLVMWLRLGL